MAVDNRTSEERRREEAIKRAIRDANHKKKEAQDAKLERTVLEAANVKDQISRSADPIEALNRLLGVDLPRPKQAPSHNPYPTPPASSIVTSEDSQAKSEKILKYRRRRDDPAARRDESQRAILKLAELQDADVDCDVCNDPLYERWWRCRKCEPSVRICKGCGDGDSRCPGYGHKMEKRRFEV